jgi:hypothetical protein
MEEEENTSDYTRIANAFMNAGIDFTVRWCIGLKEVYIILQGTTLQFGDIDGRKLKFIDQEAFLIREGNVND